MDGHTHRVRLWDITSDLNLETSRPLNIKHTAAIRALLVTGPSGTKILSGGDDRLINVFDIAADRPVSHVDCSSRVHHLHATSQRDSVLVEARPFVLARFSKVADVSIQIRCSTAIRSLKSEIFVRSRRRLGRKHGLGTRQMGKGLMPLSQKVAMRPFMKRSELLIHPRFPFR